MVENNSISVNLQMYAWISSTIGIDDSAGGEIKRQVKPGTTLAGLFTELANEHDKFRDFVFNPADCSMNDEVVMIVNNKLVQFSDAKDSVMQDQDTITLSPVLVGG
jgi:sulfur carrier protein ThiS